MLNKNLKKLDSSGRLCIPSKLAKQVGIKPNSTIAICTYEECDAIMLKPADQIDNCKVIAFARVESTGRVVLPSLLMPEGRHERYVDVYLFNGDLIVEEVVIRN